MAGRPMTPWWRSIALPAAAAAAAGVLLHASFPALEQGVTRARYAVRGHVPADTSVVLVYIDDQAVRTLGWPVRRNFYALMVTVLRDLKVGAVGLEPVFEARHSEYVEYDNLLAAVSAEAGNVVATSYFDRVTADGYAPEPDTAQAGRAKADVRLVTLRGAGYHGPFEGLREAVAGVGHVNFTEQGDVPAFIQRGLDLEPSFGLEILRVALRGKVEYRGTGQDARPGTDRGRVIVRGRTGEKAFDAPGGIARLVYPGPVSSFVRYPFLEVLRSYDEVRADREPTVPVARLRGKIVLVGLLAEGRGQFFPTPVDPRMPSLAVHAAFLDNALNSRFLADVPFWVLVLASLSLGALCMAAAVFCRPVRAAAVLGAALLSWAGLSQALFAAGSTVLPLVPAAVTVMAAAGAVLVRGHRRTQTAVSELTEEKGRILEQLRDREARVVMLERELAGAESAGASERTKELLEEIRTYRSEIRSLASRADDMEPYAPGAEGDADAATVFEGIVYARDGAMRPVIDFVGKIAESAAPVLILGESGTGKEMVARAIHARSGRRTGPFVAVNCGALSEGVLESELFGHEKGAFTGAVKDRMGRFELAHQGTIFLDEIGETNDGFQVKLLRVLQRGEFERVGGSQTLRADVRVVAATNRNLKDLVRTGGFREDLFYRLNVLTVEIAPLRERREDIPLLVQHFLKTEGEGLSISRNVMEALEAYSWPGNIRELESAIRRAALLARADRRGMISVRDLTDEVAAAVRGKVPLEEQILTSLREKEFSRSSITETAAEVGGLNRGTVAEYLRGEAIKAFVEHRFDLERAVQAVSLSADGRVNERVQKRLVDYLANLVEALERGRPWDEAREGLRPKMKNLPQRYHRFLEQAAEAYFRGLWQLPAGTTGAPGRDVAG
jgi:transcriptional regulator with PAS, ATPase and Fis domain